MRVLTAGESSRQVAGKSDGVLSNREKPGSAAVLGTKRETPVKHLKGIRECSCKKVTQSVTQLKCLYTNAHSMGTEQEELEATA